ncbi:hypothetical protein SRHO_G00282410 [Serrasalmus rhombeus]
MNVCMVSTFFSVSFQHPWFSTWDVNTARIFYFCYSRRAMLVAQSSRRRMREGTNPSTTELSAECEQSSRSRPKTQLKKKSQSVDIASQGFPASLIPGLSINRSSPPVARTTTFEVQENNTSNSQRRSPRCGELKRGYTIGK